MAQHEPHTRHEPSGPPVQFMILMIIIAVGIVGIVLRVAGVL